MWTIVPTADPEHPAYSELAGISCASAVHCLAVGYETDTQYHADLTLAEKWDGATWSIVPSDAPGRNFAQSSVLHAMSCSTPTICLAVGYRERTSGTFATFAERWNGTRWVVAGSASPSGSIYSELGAISCVRSGRCSAVGTYFDQAGDFAPLTETWTGTAWHPRAAAASAPPSARIAYLQSVSCAASFCLATGTHGSPANLDTFTTTLSR